MRNLTHCKQQTRECPHKFNSQSPTDWPKHSRTGTCNTCELYKKLLKGGRPPKRKCTGKGLHNVDKVNASSNPTTTNYSFNLTLNTDNVYTVSHKLDILGKDKEVETIFICAICHCILSSPSVQTPCEHNYCSPCLKQWFAYINNTVPCPVCQANVKHDDVTTSPRVLRFQLNALTAVCTVCGTLGKLSKMAGHVCPEIKKPLMCHCDLCTQNHTPTPPHREESEQSSLREEITKAANLLK